MPPNDQITCSTTVLAPSNSNSRFRSTHRSEHIQDRCHHHLSSVSLRMRGHLIVQATSNMARAFTKEKQANTETLEEKDDNEKVPEPQVARSSGQRSNRNGYLSLILNPPEPETTTNSVELRANSPTVTRRNNPIQRDVETVPAAMPLEQTSGPHPQISNVELQELSPFQPYNAIRFCACIHKKITTKTNNRCKRRRYLVDVGARDVGVNGVVGFGSRRQSGGRKKPEPQWDATSVAAVGAAGRVERARSDLDTRREKKVIQTSMEGGSPYRKVETKAMTETHRGTEVAGKLLVQLQDRKKTKTGPDPD
ncbi:hypothetical protein B0H34DRAFT_673583 [Crassisporium funariophilum]|nr:hypothetical protein B0H34DRAFT_673583 [Crassisporium funariophilum]